MKVTISFNLNVKKICQRGTIFYEKETLNLGWMIKLQTKYTSIDSICELMIE